MGKFTALLKAYLDNSRQDREEMEKLSSGLEDELADYDMDMDLICFELDQHKDALAETLREGQTKDETIAMQSNALSEAWAEIQRLKAEIEQTKRGTALPQLDIEKANGLYKKRKLI